VKRVLLLLSIIWVPLSTCTGCTKLVSFHPVSRTDEEYAVYSMVINANHRGYLQGGFLILNRTHGYDIGGIDASQSPQVVIDDYEVSNAESYQLDDQFDLEQRYTLFSIEEHDEVFASGPDGWEELHKRYPDSDGYITLSKVGFDPGMSQALVYMAYGCGPTCGIGDLYYLVKSGDTWAIQSVTLLWIS
jgi:hypothetical protein